MKYKKSISCKKPKGFSQKQYCKFGRKKKGGGENWTSYSQDDLINIINNETTTSVKLKTIIDQLNTFENGDLTVTTKPGYMALIRYNQLTDYSDDTYNEFELKARTLMEESSDIEGVQYRDMNHQELTGLNFHRQFIPTPRQTTESELATPPEIPLART